tara:strand:- start:216 stop:752 length:537 start_codon:yes stop_codon:yes gene_type:complete
MNIDKRDIVIRRIENIDLKHIECIEADVNPEDQLIVEEMNPMFNAASDIVEYNGHVAEYGGLVVGYIISFKIVAISSISAVIRCVVDEDYRRCGVGSLLLDTVDPQTEGHKVSIECKEDNYGSMKFLKSAGYVVTQCNESEYDEDGEVDFDGYFVLTKEKREPMTLKNRLAMYPYYGE